ncbi:MAG: hypothetical protein KDI56_15360 [Xanthomonadales bacterium]|nr:hypothetical protein [Xanthomonadales bacterium]MCB1626922.1 hypothetical protein [Xanthomonadales bacterium]
MTKLLLTLLLAGCLATTPTLAALREAFVDPVQTGDGIRPLLELPGANQRDLRHFLAIDDARRNGFLYVHLAGSGGLPENSLEIIREAASQGFHAVSLAYPNWPSVTDLTIAGGDLAAPGQVRAERLYGEDVSPLVDVDQPNSVVNRLVRLLLTLQDSHPDEGWGRFLQQSQPDWSHIVVGGHSQGAGHAAYLAQEQALAGALLFGGPGDFVTGLGVAEWVQRPLQIEARGVYGFVHQQDPNYALFQLTQGILGLSQGGPTQNVDLIAPSQWLANRLDSSRIDVPEANFHGAVVVDDSLPTDPDGSIGYAPVWRYMLGVALFADGAEP